MPVFLKQHVLGLVIDNSNAEWFVITCKIYYHKNDFMKHDIVALMAAEHRFIRSKRLA